MTDAAPAAAESRSTVPARVAKEHLRAFVERIERLEEEKKTIADDVRDVYAEAKANGFDVARLGSRRPAHRDRGVSARRSRWRTARAPESVTRSDRQFRAGVRGRLPPQRLLECADAPASAQARGARGERHGRQE